MTTRMGVSIATLLAVGALLSCASGPGKESNFGGTESRSESSSESDATADTPRRSSYAEAEANASADTCADRPCVADSDCCKGASCGYDPERSHVQRYCMGM